MGLFVIKPWVKIAAWMIALIIVSLNVKLVVQEVQEWIAGAGSRAWIIWITIVPLCFAAFGLLLYITFKPIIQKRRAEKDSKIPHGAATQLNITDTPSYSRIAICIDFSSVDSLTIKSALSQGGKQATYILIHVVETAGALVYGSEIADMESIKDSQALKDYAQQLLDKGYQVDIRIGYGNPRRTIPKMVKEFKADLLVMGAHGHQFFKDILLGATVDTVRHRVEIPVLIVQHK
jgi:manganese transport protein